MNLKISILKRLTEGTTVRYAIKENINKDHFSEVHISYPENSVMSEQPFLM